MVEMQSNYALNMHLFFHILIGKIQIFHKNNNLYKIKLVVKINSVIILANYVLKY